MNRIDLPGCVWHLTPFGLTGQPLRYGATFVPANAWWGTSNIRRTFRREGSVGAHVAQSPALRVGPGASESGGAGPQKQRWIDRFDGVTFNAEMVLSTEPGRIGAHEVARGPFGTRGRHEASLLLQHGMP